ncbi:MFS transporter [Sphingomonas sp. IC081]|uniref:MFS transporter n=1 Tax=Sphingomonas sp. IC081 TaxID=304378 RepID=UPI00115B50BF|nr:MFS transporter [Sphingomonas sp. IC081]QDK31870.1 MFS transporter [Sphingomonas sp. IC081]
MKPRLPLLRILEMNLGFFGVQFSFGLQQANIGPIYAYLGASEAAMPLLWLAGPITGLLVQPLVGALSDRTVSPLGKRAPWFLLGAAICSACLFAMPYSSALWMAAGLLWLLDAGNNITMEPYRAYVADRLDAEQQALGFLTQSAFTGLAQTLAYLAPSLLSALLDRALLDANGVPTAVRLAFGLGALISLTSALYSVWRVPELPAPVPPNDMKATWRPLLAEIADALREMPPALRQLALAMLFQWYAMFAYWQYVPFALARALHGTSDAHSPAFRAAVMTAQQLGALYNLVAFAAALAMVPAVGRYGARGVQTICLAAAGLGMLALPAITSPAWLIAPMLGIGLGWAGMMGNNYVLLAAAVPARRTGVYMGLCNILIVLPMLLETVTLPLLYEPVLRGDPRKVLVLAGLLLLAGALAMRFVGTKPDPAERHQA